MIVGVKHCFIDKVRYVYYLFFNERFRFNMARYKSTKFKKDKKLIKKELAALKQYWGFIPMQYYTHDFYRQDCELSIEEMKTYIPSYYFYFILYPKFDNLKGAGYILENKIVCYYLFKGMDLPTSPIIGMKKGRGFVTPDGQFHSSKEFLEVIRQSNTDKVFVKPVSGCGGKGILILKKEVNKLSLDGKEFTYEDLDRLEADYVIEPKIIQTAYLDSVYPNSVNTLRAVTCRDPSGVVRLIAVTLRMGTHGKEVDNSAQGGLLIGINLDTGKPIRDYAGYEYGCEKLYSHPDSGFNFCDLFIENWCSIKADIVDFAKKMTLYNLVGWDVALTKDGPIVIEANTKFGIDHSQSGVGGMKELFFHGEPTKWNKERSI
ncbi:hypothetical protein PA25_26110 [Pseudoalteromonas sp. A25]|uniref:sugar-transfer associated ATP-grasp domain-containing protein n=1 Tax=Pseudoalteromonas sp. A25 TaxID=116092 RepID=UPI0012606386|nr:sugar-transfer associated ATP-grasp domain-containing protein [Pseudoalteromonas sp. A25]BBN82626.1 hypothetical protein PA25_26110 [Pseudoalteromonas sp. A25]